MKLIVPWMYEVHSDFSACFLAPYAAAGHSAFLLSLAFKQEEA